jgi:hypothetical protein
VGGSCALKVTFPRLFEICNQLEWSVARVLRNGNLKLTFRRNFGAAQEVEWADLTAMMENIHLTHSSDTVRWVFEKSGQFSTASLYRELVFPGSSEQVDDESLESDITFEDKIFSVANF